ncbi:hypothetical protein [Nonomuraea jiangxiensis]|uniref:Uncharacterized protein n=1 Tax=Nonomuraea jiangxiensis TaxID=633440 RepID=A0A1G9QPE0_9ACTN|nr:hypothetical protein [Nonomuraea jiangxiensis]SDM12155.1 hypothetical protein SAMN05421869_13687 [Nonomuraea jiangxiensis]
MAVAGLVLGDVWLWVAVECLPPAYAEVVDLCLTVKSFRTAPPQRTAGWDQVNEVPIVSRSGRLTVPWMGEGGEVVKLKP